MMHPQMDELVDYMKAHFKTDAFDIMNENT